MREVTGNLDSAQRSLGTAVGNIEGTLTSLAEIVTFAQKAAEDSRTTIEQLVREQKSTTEILGQFDSVAGKVAGVVAAMERCQKETEDAASEIADSVAALDENMTAFAGWFEKANTTLGETTSSFAASLRVEVEQCSAALSSGLSRAADSLKEVIDSSTTTLDGNLTTFADRFETVNTTLGQTATDFATSVRSEVEKYCVTLDNSLASAAASLRTAVKDIEDVLPTASTSLGTGVKSMEDALKRLETAMARLKPDEGTLRETTTLLTALKAWEATQKQERQS
jgi:DNA anti-recombination protein RmuC